MTDPFAHYDAPYVIGSLSPEDRREFEQHLKSCESCAAAVRELEGLPGLLARTPSPEPLPDLLPEVLKRVRRGRRIRNAVTAVSAALAVSACVGLAVVTLHPSQPPPVAMQALGEFPVRADARLAAQEWGTRVDMSCSYTGGRSGGEYVLVAIARDGTVTQLATWRAVPDDTARIVVGTKLKQTDLTALEIRSGTGKPLLRLTL